MLPNLLDDLLRAWDTRGPEGTVTPGADEQPAAVTAQEPAATPSPMDSLLSSLLTSYESADAPAEPTAELAEIPLLHEPVRAVRQPVLCKYVAVSLGWHKFAVPVESVVEAGRHPRTTLAPGLPACVRGVFNFRGEVLPVIDMHVMAGAEPAANPSESRILTIQSADQQTRAAFAFDTLEGIVNLDPEPGGRVEPDHPLAALLAAVSQNDNREPFGLLAVERLFEQAGFESAISTGQNGSTA